MAMTTKSWKKISWHLIRFVRLLENVLDRWLVRGQQLPNVCSKILLTFIFNHTIFSESLQEVDVLLDTLRVTKTQYLNVLQVAAPNEENRSAELLNKSKSFLWVSRRKVVIKFQ
jgi:hypothetical protein